MKYIGYYNEHGYQVLEFTDEVNDGNYIYRAGNCPYDSIQILHKVSLQ